MSVHYHARFIVLALLLLAATAQANVVLNPGFELGWKPVSGNPVGWTADNMAWFDTTQRAHTGLYGMYCNRPDGLSWLVSDVTVPAGDYHVAVWANTWWQGVQLLVRLGDDEQLWDLEPADKAFYLYETDMTTSGPAQLAFAGYSSEVDHLVIDDVELTPVDSPEPTGLLVTGFGLTMLYVWRRWRD
jgi:hypothetical protein